MTPSGLDRPALRRKTIFCLSHLTTLSVVGLPQDSAHLEEFESIFDAIAETYDLVLVDTAGADDAGPTYLVFPTPQSAAEAMAGCKSWVFQEVNGVTSSRLEIANSATLWPARRQLEHHRPDLRLYYRPELDPHAGSTFDPTRFLATLTDLELAWKMIRLSVGDATSGYWSDALPHGQQRPVQGGGGAAAATGTALSGMQAGPSAATSFSSGNDASAARPAKRTRTDSSDLTPSSPGLARSSSPTNDSSMPAAEFRPPSSPESPTVPSLNQPVSYFKHRSMPARGVMEEVRKGKFVVRIDGRLPDLDKNGCRDLAFAMSVKRVNPLIRIGLCVNPDSKQVVQYYLAIYPKAQLANEAHRRNLAADFVHGNFTSTLYAPGGFVDTRQGSSDQVEFRLAIDARYPDPTYSADFGCLAAGVAHLSRKCPIAIRTGASNSILMRFETMEDAKAVVLACIDGIGSSGNGGRIFYPSLLYEPVDWTVGLFR